MVFEVPHDFIEPLYDITRFFLITGMSLWHKYFNTGKHQLVFFILLIFMSTLTLTDCQSVRLVIDININRLVIILNFKTVIITNVITVNYKTMSLSWLPRWESAIMMKGGNMTQSISPHPTPRIALSVRSFVRPSKSTASGVLDVCVGHAA